MNSCNFVGRLTKEVSLRYTPNGVAKAEFTIAVNRIFSEGTDFIQIEVWKKDAENCANFLDKGKMCSVEGRYRVDTFDGQDGQKRWKHYIVANPGGVRFLSPKEANQTHDNDLGTDVNFSDEDIPF